MNICRNCGALIMEFPFTEEWWHYAATSAAETPRLHCIGNSGPVAQP